MSKLLEDKPRPWGVHRLADMFSPHVATGIPGRGWVASVSEPYHGGRLAATWWVITGRAYAVVWPKPGDLETAFDSARATQEQPE